jgi:methylglyoxal synthase
LEKIGVIMKKLTLAVIAHDSKKEDLLLLIKSHLEEISQLHLISTGETAGYIAENTRLPVDPALDVAQGGDVQIGALVTQREVDAVVFLRNVLNPRQEEPDVFALLRVCDIHEVPLATNVSTGEAVLHLIFEHPEALVGHHLAAALIEDNAAIHNP